MYASLAEPNKMSDLTKTPNTLEEQKRQLRRTSSLRDLITRATQKRTILALDTSGSMSSLCQNGRTRAENLRDAIKDLPDMPCVTFGLGVHLFESQSLASTEPGGGTPLTEAIKLAKDNGYSHLIIVTDGQPNDPAGALREAVDLKIDAIYVSDPPVPEFLITLSGGQVNNIRVDSLTFTKELTSAIKGLIGGTV